MLGRTHTCGELRLESVGKRVLLAGWVDRRRDHGGLIFVDLRDRYGITQAVFNPELHPELFRAAEALRSEYVVAIKGKVARRPEGTANPNLPTGEVEVLGEELEILNTSMTPPIEVRETSQVSEELRLRYRYLDLRRRFMQRNLIFRHRLSKIIRDYCDSLGFLEIETPMLTKSTPEGARDYLVPSRLNPGNFYALPQSPQLFKQLLMCSGFDRYFQIARCFRDEDLRANRQPEFTQLDLEMSFVTEEDVQHVTEGLLVKVVKELMGQEVKAPFPRLSYREALEKYGTDAPDMRFEMTFVDITDIAKESAFEVFRTQVQSGGVVKGLNVRSAAEKFSRKDMETLSGLVLGFGAKGITYFKVDADGSFASPAAKFFSPAGKKAIRERCAASPGDLLIFIAEREEVVFAAGAELRKHLAERLDLIAKNTLKFCWVVDFPLLEWNAQTNRLDPLHHPFTSPTPETLKFLESEPLKVKARAYDIVLNGEEIGGGSIRIHRSDVQERVFRLLQIGPEEAHEKFGFLLEALQYGAPPHGGIALGLDRLAMILLGLQSIRDVIAFPKTQKAFCPLTSSPSKVTPEQLRELGLEMFQTP